MALAENDTKLTIQGHTLSLGFRSTGADDARDIVPYHEVGLIAIADGAAQQIRITIEFWADLREFNPIELGLYNSVEHTVTFKAPISEFDRVWRMLRQEQPLFFVFNQFNVVDSPHPHVKRVTAASIQTGSEPGGAAAQRTD